MAQKRKAIEVVDLLSDDEDENVPLPKQRRLDSTNEGSATATVEPKDEPARMTPSSVAAPPQARVADDSDHGTTGVDRTSARETPAPNDAAHIVTTPPAPNKERNLYDIPPIDERYVPHRSYEDGVDYRDPHKFTLQPFFWRRWQPYDYVNLSEHIRAQFDPIPFARATNKPVEEVNLVMSRLVANPLYDAGEALKRAEEGMMEVKDLLKKHRTPCRPWLDGKVTGQLDKVGAGSVKLIVPDGSQRHIEFAELGKTDVLYLEQNLTEIDWKLVSGEAENSEGIVEKGDEEFCLT